MPRRRAPDAKPACCSPAGPKADLPHPAKTGHPADNLTDSLAARAPRSTVTAVAQPYVGLAAIALLGPHLTGPVHLGTDFRHVFRQIPAFAASMWLATAQTRIRFAALSTEMKLVSIQGTSGRLTGHVSGSDRACFPGRCREFGTPCCAASQDAAGGVRRGAELGRAACPGGKRPVWSSSPMGSPFRIRPSHRNLP